MSTQGRTAAAPPPDISKTFQRLAESATRLNKASDELSKAIVPVEAALKKLNLGISKWYAFVDGRPDENGDYSTCEIGYAKVGGKWCLALAERSRNAHDPRGDSETEWAFNDAPRQLRIRALREVPNLVEALVGEADKVTGALEDETKRAHELGDTLTALANAHAARR
jgi:hypothetical protein